MTAGLDPRQPFLDHHRPGGLPLLGTVMGIELMAKAALLFSDRKHVTGIEAVRIQAPLIFSVECYRSIALRTQAHGIAGGEAWMDCDLASAAPDGDNIVHFTGRVLAGAAFPAVPAFGTIPENSGFPEVGQEDIYRLFFHGPCFRVLHSVRWTGKAAVGRLARGLPALQRQAQVYTVVAPQVLEFCLQTAGLLELADTGRLMIPERIARIERLSDIGAGSSVALLAVASRRDDDAAAIDVLVLDEEGRVHVRVHSYRTCPLPFAADADAIALLRQKMRWRR